ncbi:MAG: hypothetical protein R3C26_06620 [Calditrichia bacterium]
MPHFWLLILNLSEDYQRAGFPTLSEFVRSAPDFPAHIYVDTGNRAVMFDDPAFRHRAFGCVALVALWRGVWLIWMSRELLSSSEKNGMFRAMFMRINIYMLVVMVFLSIDRLIV